MNKKLTIVVVTWNALSYTKVTLNSLFRTVRLPVNIVIIDNGSNKETVDFLDKLQPPQNFSLKLILNDKNLGITTAYNQGLSASLDLDSDYTIFCNNDLFFSNNWLEKMTYIMENNPNIAILNPLRPSVNDFYPDGHSTLEILEKIVAPDAPKKEIELFIDSPIDKFDDFCAKLSDYNIKFFKTGLRIIHFPDSLSLCICMARNSVFKKIGYFAEPSFIKYGGEDIDMCWYIMKKGFDCAITNRVYIHHFRNKSITENNLDRKKALAESNKKLYALWRNDILDFIIKNKITCLENNTNSNTWLLRQLTNGSTILDDIKNEQA